jgi:hypothetical protein
MVRPMRTIAECANCGENAVHCSTLRHGGVGFISVVRLTSRHEKSASLERRQVDKRDRRRKRIRSEHRATKVHVDPKKADGTSGRGLALPPLSSRKQKVPSILVQSLGLEHFPGLAESSILRCGAKLAAVCLD